MRNEARLTGQIEAKSKERAKQIAMLENLSAEGADIARMMRILNRSKPTVQKILKENNIHATGYVPIPCKD